jgi:hypothetical protein
MISTSAMAIVGGRAGDAWLNDAFILDVDALRWTRIQMNPVSVLLRPMKHSFLFSGWFHGSLLHAETR